MNLNTVVITLLSGFLSLITVLLTLYLRSINANTQTLRARIDNHEKRFESVDKDIECLSTHVNDYKIDFERRFVPTELFLRETGFTRRKLDELCASVNRLEGNLTVVDKLPQICGDIARAVVSEMKKEKGAAN
jgi:hypothetical protein